MIDLETMGNDTNSAIVSIGAVKFDPYTGKTGDEFYTLVSLQDSLNKGLTVSGDTIEWWMKQSDAARNHLFDSWLKPVSLATALFELTGFIKNDNIDYHIWAKSPSFDCAILKNAFKACDLPLPWDFRKELDVRTLIYLMPLLKKSGTFVDTADTKGVAHNALDDCINQIRYCCEIMSR